MKADDEWTDYSENGWSMSYRHIAKNLVYVEASKVNQGAAPNKPGDLEMAGTPFSVIFEQYVPCIMTVSGTVVGNGQARFSTNKGMYLYAPSYGNSVGYRISGIVSAE